MFQVSGWDKKKNRIKILYLTSFIVIVMAVIFYLIYLVNNNNRKLTEINHQQITPTKTIPTSIPSFMVSRNMTLEEYKDNQKKFVSSKLGISFYYIANYTNINQKYIVKEVCNKVYLYPEGSDYTSGQSVEVFSKDKNESLKDAVSRMFLLNKDTNQCEIKISTPKNLPSNYIRAEITLSSNIDMENLDPDEYINKTKACSKYASPTSISYFFEDKKHSKKFVYFNIGLEALMGSETETWQDTITFLD